MTYSCIATPPEPASRGGVHGKPTKYIYLKWPCKDPNVDRWDLVCGSGTATESTGLTFPIAPGRPLAAPDIIEQIGQPIVKDL